MANLSGKTALVTGASRGIGRASALALGEAGAQVLVHYGRGKARLLVRIPDAVSFEQAAATWTAYGAAWGGLLALSRLAAGQTVLQPAASSSVGRAALQIANRLGARPIALTRTKAKVDEPRARGAAAVVSAQEENDEQDLVGEIKRLTDGKGADLVFDPVGGPAFAKLVEATAPGGLLILYGALSRDPTV